MSPTALPSPCPVSDLPTLLEGGKAALLDFCTYELGLTAL